MSKTYVLLLGECCINVWWVKLAYSIVQVFTFLADLLCHFSIHDWKWSLQVSDYCCIIYLFLHFSQFLLYVFWFSVIKCIYVYSCYIFLTDWPFYHYKMSLFLSSSIFLVLKSILSVRIAHSSFLMFAVCVACPHQSLYFQSICILKI